MVVRLVMDRLETAYLIRREMCQLDHKQDIDRYVKRLVSEEQERRSRALSSPEAGYFSIEREKAVVYEDNYGVRKRQVHMRKPAMEETHQRLPRHRICPDNYRGVSKPAP